MDYGDGLENRCGGNLTGGSNPSPSAKSANCIASTVRCQSGRMGPPAKRLKGQKLFRGFESHSPRLLWCQHAPSWLSGLERLPAEEEVTGSNPVEGAFLFGAPVPQLG